MYLIHISFVTKNKNKPSSGMSHMIIFGKKNYIYLYLSYSQFSDPLTICLKIFNSSQPNKIQLKGTLRDIFNVHHFIRDLYTPTIYYIKKFKIFFFIFLHLIV